MLNINNTNHNQPVFRSYWHTIKNSAGDVINRGDTCFFRNDLDFKELVNFMENKYKNLPKVNVINYACSNGEETYSLITLLHEKLGEKAFKYFPITAKDIEEEHIKKAKDGIYSIEGFETYGINFFLKTKFFDYFNAVDPNINYFRKEKKLLDYVKNIVVEVKDSIKNNAEFIQSNILDDIDKTNLKNTVLLVRNFWAYLNDTDRTTLAQKLSKMTDKTSTLVIGDFDKEHEIHTLLSKYGFRETQVENVFEKLC